MRTTLDIEDDVLIHRTYFQYMNILLNMFTKNEYSVLAAYNGDDDGDVNDETESKSETENKSETSPENIQNPISA